MIKRRAAMLAVCAVLLFCVFTAGCSGPAASPTPSTATNTSTNTTSAQAAPSTQVITPSASVSTPSPSATPAPSAFQTPSNTPATPSAAPAVAGSTSLTLQFFYRPECPFCQALEPQITALQTTYAGKVSVQWIQSTGEVPTLVLLNQNGAQVGGPWVNPGTTAPITAQIDSLLAAS